MAKPKTILGISAFYHDSAAALTADDEIVAAAQEERFTRKKHTADFPKQAIRYCLDEGGYTLDELDAVVFYDKPLLKFERLLETYYAFAPRGLLSFLAAIPIWVQDKLFLKRVLHQSLAELEKYDKKTLRLLFSSHHLSHAASAFYPSPFQEAAILTIDGVGEWATASISRGRGKDIELIKELHFPHSVGLLYSAFTYYLGFRVNSGEYKLMGLAPYGNPEGKSTQRFIDDIRNTIVQIKNDGSICLNQKYFAYATGLRMVRDRKWEKLFGFPRLRPGEEIGQEHCDLAYAIQKVTEDIVLRMAEDSLRSTGMRNLCLAGGVALNCVANGRILRESDCDKLFIQPAAGDAGGALGAALGAYHLHFDQERRTPASGDRMKGAYLGPYFSEKEIIRTFRLYKAPYQRVDDQTQLYRQVASHIAEGHVVGWFQGRMEYGPRALGNRSILADARDRDIQKKLNLKIKYRESFRPFAPAVLAEDAADYFDLDTDSPYMLLTAPVTASIRADLPDDYHDWALWDKLYYTRSTVPAITHLDFSARIQTVHSETNAKFHGLLQAVKQRTGYGVVVNTSFNVRGEPIVCTPEDAYRCFMRTEMDILVVNDCILEKTEQPDWRNRERWRETFAPD